MDLDFLFWLAIAAVYILQAIASKRRKAGAPPIEEDPEARSEVPSELEEALGEIGRVLRGEPIESSTLPEPHYEVDVEPRSYEPPVLTRTPSSPSQRTKKPFGLGSELAASPIFYDQAFEEQTADTFHQPIITHDHVFSFKEASAIKEAAPVVERPDLRDHLVSRQSFIAAELLAPPLSKRGKKR